MLDRIRMLHDHERHYVNSAGENSLGHGGYFQGQMVGILAWNVVHSIPDPSQGS